MVGEEEKEVAEDPTTLPPTSNPTEKLREGEERIEKSPEELEIPNAPSRPSAPEIDREYFSSKGGRKKRYDDLIRPKDQTVPMVWIERVWVRLRWFLFYCCLRHSTTASNQYRIPPSHEHGNSFFEALRLLSEDALIGWLLFHYRTSFVRSIMTFLLFYFILILIFAYLMRWTEDITHAATGVTCIDGWETESTLRERFNLVFELSWTTFSTVGYGTISIESNRECSYMRFILAIEAFIGVLYVGFCGAIIYAKVDRIHATAHVTFSSAICLQYGDGVEASRFSVVPAADTEFYEIDDTNDDDDHSDDDDGDIKVTQYPFIEIRLANDRANKRFGAIADARISCTAVSIQLDDHDEATKRHQNEFFTSMNHHDGHVEISGKQQAKFGMEVAQNVRRKFSRVELTPDTHPYFEKGAWYLRHTLDSDSPLLLDSVREKLLEMEGWPVSWNDHNKIRKLLNPYIFEIGVHLAGISNLTADEVFKVHSYKPEDIYIGWKFVQMSYLDTSKRHENGGRDRFAIDLSLIHDIVPQNDEGAEGLGCRVPDSNLMKFLTRQSTSNILA